jgi:hypothetical protein
MTIACALRGYPYSYDHCFGKQARTSRRKPNWPPNTTRKAAPHRLLCLLPSPEAVAGVLEVVVATPEAAAMPEVLVATPEAVAEAAARTRTTVPGLPTRRQLVQLTPLVHS